MKKDYLESNPDAKTMDNTTLKMPPKDYILPQNLNQKMIDKFIYKICGYLDDLYSLDR
jgi:hypothetical protein